MSKNERKRAGLHKEISSIFKGVVIPQKEGGRESFIASIPDATDFAVPSQPAPESRESESPEPYQTAQILPEAESIEEPKFEPVQESKIEPVEEPKFEPVQESKIEPVEEPKFEPVQESKIEPVEEPKFEPVQESKIEPVEEPKFEPVQESKAESVEEPKVEPIQELKNEPTHAPKFITAQESEVVPVQESEIESFNDSKAEPAQETKDKLASPPKFITAQESKVIPVEESEVESTNEPEAEPAQLPKNEPVHQGKFEKAKKPKVIPVKESKKTGIDKISKKVSKKRPVVKVGGESSWKQITSKLFAGNSDTGTTKQKAMVVIVPVLFVVLLIFVFKGGVFGTSVHNAEAGEENNNSAVVSAGLNTQIDWEIPEPYPTTLRDPMQLGPVAAVNNQTENRELVKLIVKSILYSEDNSSAIISNRIVHEGDQIQGASIAKISKDSVEFEMNGKKWTQKVQRKK
jgi:outer membrane biosynthesis protein TonB